MVDKKAKKYVINQSNNQYFVGNNTSEITNWRYYMPAKYNITNEEIQEFYRLRVQKKMSYTAIGKKFNISAQTVQRRLEDFTKDSKVNLSINYNYDKYYFYDINTLEKAYWLGFITADGYVNQDKSFFHFHLGQKDVEHLEKFKQAISAIDIPIKQTIHAITGKCIVSFTVNGKEFINGLNKHGITNRKSMHEEPSSLVPIEFYRDYIRGLWDGDGYISKKRIGFCSSYNMCAWVQKQLMLNCAVPYTKIGFDSNIYRLTITKGKNNVLKWLYYSNSKSISLYRKYKDAKISILHEVNQKQKALLPF